MPYVIIAFFTVVVFGVVNMIGGTKNDMVVDMAFVNVGRNDVGMSAFQQTVGKLQTNLMGFFIRNFSRSEGLYQMECLVWIRLPGFGQRKTEVICSCFRTASKG